MSGDAKRMEITVGMRCLFRNGDLEGNPFVPCEIIGPDSRDHTDFEWVIGFRQPRFRNFRETLAVHARELWPDKPPGAEPSPTTATP